MLADRMEGRQAAPAATPEQVAEYTGMPAAPKKEGDTRWTNYSRRVFAAGQVRRLGPSAYPDGMPCKACRSVKPTGGCGAMALKERCKAYRVWVKAQRAAAAAEGGAQ